jgi:hypothetical protein
MFILSGWFYIQYTYTFHNDLGFFLDKLLMQFTGFRLNRDLQEGSCRRAAIKISFFWDFYGSVMMIPGKILL